MGRKNNHYVLIDMDGDGYIGTTDIEHALKLLTQNELSMDEIQCVWEKVQIEKFIISLFFPVFLRLTTNNDLIVNSMILGIGGGRH